MSEEKIPNVIIITLSGVRNIDSIEDPTHQYIPNLWNKMRKEGVLYTNLIDLNSQFHIPVVQAIDTGKICPFFSSSKDIPSIFQYVRKKYGLPAHKLWSIGHWFSSGCVYGTDDYPQGTYPAELTSVFSSVSAELKKILTKQELIFLKSYREMEKKTEAISRFPQWDSIGVVQYQIFKKIMRKFKPKLVHYMMADVESAHYGTFGRYVLALRHSDKRIFKIWQMIKEDPFYKDNTYLIISPDHERNSYYIHHDENLYGNPSQVWMYIYGPGIKKGKIIDRSVHHIDIFATVAYIMDVETHPTEGKILKDCFYDGEISLRFR